MLIPTRRPMISRPPGEHAVLRWHRQATRRLLLLMTVACMALLGATAPANAQINIADIRVTSKLDLAWIWPSQGFICDAAVPDSRMHILVANVTTGLSDTGGARHILAMDCDDVAKGRRLRLNVIVNFQLQLNGRAQADYRIETWVQPCTGSASCAWEPLDPRDDVYAGPAAEIPWYVQRVTPSPPAAFNSAVTITTSQSKITR